MLIFFVLLILALAPAAVYFLLSNKTTNQKRQLMYAVRQNSSSYRPPISKPPLVELQRTTSNLVNFNTYTNTNTNTTANVNTSPSTEDVVKITYTYPNFNRTITCENCTLYLSPLENSFILSNIDNNTTVEVHDSAEINGSIWYEVSVNSEARINNKGWIKENSITNPFKPERLV